MDDGALCIAVGGGVVGVVVGGGAVVYSAGAWIEDGGAVVYSAGAWIEDGGAVTFFTPKCILLFKLAYMS